MSKYYTPTIEEFHVGFEYEEGGLELFSKKIWDHCDEHLSNLEQKLDANIIRVKHLDREDIESFGFVQESLASFVNKDSWYIEWMPEDTLDIYCVSDCRFKGKIKNKSELKRILTQIGVI